MDKIKDIYNGLLPWEKADFCDWLFEKGELGDKFQKALEEELEDKVEEVLDDKHEEWRLNMIDKILQMI